MILHWQLLVVISTRQTVLIRPFAKLRYDLSVVSIFTLTVRIPRKVFFVLLFLFVPGKLLFIFLHVYPHLFHFYLLIALQLAVIDGCSWKYPRSSWFEQLARASQWFYFLHVSHALIVSSVICCWQAKFILLEGYRCLRPLILFINYSVKNIWTMRIVSVLSCCNHNIFIIQIMIWIFLAILHWLYFNKSFILNVFFVVRLFHLIALDLLLWHLKLSRSCSLSHVLAIDGFQRIILHSLILIELAFIKIFVRRPRHFLNRHKTFACLLVHHVRLIMKHISQWIIM